MKIINVCGARPNFMKIAPLIEAYQGYPGTSAVLVHTGQHYDAAMSELFFQQLGIPEPDINLGVGSGSHATQTGEIMKRFEPVMLEHRPDMVVVVGDVNSTIACSLTAVKLGVPVAHVEAGLRSGDRAMPEEINRILTDAISDWLFCTEASGVENLRHEGIPESRIHMVGHVMIDTLLHHRQQAEQSTILETLALAPRSYAAMTLHRPSNVDDPAVFTRILHAIEVIQQDLPIIFPVHPRTRAMLDRDVIRQRIAAMPNLRCIEPLGYLDFLRLTSQARLVLTDSGGIQEETTILQVPCLTLRDNTERPITLECGWNQLVGNDTERIVAGYRAVVSQSEGKTRTPELWDGQAAERIAKILLG